MKPLTAGQKAAVEKVRAYLKAARLTPEDDETRNDGTHVFTVADRDDRDVGEESPGKDIREQFAGYVKALRELSPLAFVGTECVDEWVHLTVTIRPTPRKVKPEEIPRLTDKMMEQLPESILRHPRVTKVFRHVYRDRGSGVEVRTDIPSPIGKRSAVLEWAFTGSSIDGWVLTMRWGVHFCSRPATFKKLTPKILLDMLDRILQRLDDPLDCLGWTIEATNENGSFLRRPGGSHRATFWEAEVTTSVGNVRCPPGASSVVWTNLLTGQSAYLNGGEKIPDNLKPLDVK